MFTLTHITHPTVDTKKPLLLLQSEHGDKFLFGQIPEGTQRTFPENKTRLSKLESIFLTGILSWESIGGLPGMILTLSDQGVKSMNLFHGKDIINFAVATWRYFVFRFGMQLKTEILADSQVYENKLMRVQSILVGSSADADESTDHSLPKGLNNALKNIVLKMFPQHEPTARHDPASDPQMNVEIPQSPNMPTQSTCYEISLKPIRGRFKVEEAMRLGVPKGQLFAQLTKGQSVTLEDGKIVEPHQVLEKQRNFAKVLILDIPSDSYLPQFRKKFENYDKSCLGAVYYFLGDDVTMSKQLVELMEDFDQENTHHFISHSKICPNSIVFKSSAITTLKLKAIQPQNYNLPLSDRVFSKEFYECFKKSLPRGTSMVQQRDQPLTSKIEGEKVHVMLQNDSVLIEPFTLGEEPLKMSCHQSFRPMPPWSTVYERHITPLKITGASYTSVVEGQGRANNFNNGTSKGKVEVITLGTGSSLPSKYRNVISTLVKVPYVLNGKPYDRNILLDAGENTLGTIKRTIPDAELPELFRNLKLIYLSHLHADHHLGIASLLSEWYKHNAANLSANIYLVIPWQYRIFLKEWLSMECHEIKDRIKFISCEHLIDGGFVRKEFKPLPFENFQTLGGPNIKKRRLECDDKSSFRDRETITQMYRDLKILTFQTCRAKHCDWAYSNSITFFTKSDTSSVFKISYSGDTRPNVEKFAKSIGQNSDLLIHEATLDNELLEDAVKKRHCTINEAIEVSNQMGAHKLILTHFSQRYPKLPQIDNNIKIDAKEYCFAFDGMIVTYDNIGGQTSKLGLLNSVFTEEQFLDDQDEIKGPSS
ncbi:LAME_0D01354g1_1 [Lachancea meyersii CBS 8951]|uniref:ribonuclease Z n=1 Tax=Lachancea meyersii CBS 8951 TaxID=1266667 RepID=A0A1G4J6J2_9SACH|nr:LAME_0D01354g1_1 [Lachancea meyersii CBS 8951]